MREFQLIPKLLLTLRDMSLSQPTIAAISNVLSHLLQGFPNSNDLLRWVRLCRLRGDEGGEWDGPHGPVRM